MKINVFYGTKQDVSKLLLEKYNCFFMNHGAYLDSLHHKNMLSDISEFFKDFKKSNGNLTLNLNINSLDVTEFLIALGANRWDISFFRVTSTGDDVKEVAMSVDTLKHYMENQIEFR